MDRRERGIHRYALCTMSSAVKPVVHRYTCTCLAIAVVVITVDSKCK